MVTIFFFLSEWTLLALFKGTEGHVVLLPEAIHSFEDNFG